MHSSSPAPVATAETVMTDRQSPSILVAIASYGTKQDHFLERLLAVYRALPMRVRVVILSNQEKPATGTEVLVGLPSPDPYSLPFAHRKLFAENADNYDYFIYSEDDTLLTEQHLQAFLAAQPLLQEDEIVGFIRSETDPSGAKFITSIHHHFRWRTDSLVERGGEIFARLSNEHSGCFIVSKAQLRRALDSGGFMVAPHAETYGMLESAASDLYTQCGLRRLVCLSRIEDFIVPHLPNKYYSFLGITLDELRTQVATLLDLHRNGGWTGLLHEPQSGAHGYRWSHNLYEAGDSDLSSAIGSTPQRVLSIAAGSGLTEQLLAKNGHTVRAIPLDAVFGGMLEQRGIRVSVGPLREALAALGQETFDVVLVRGYLQLLREPAPFLAAVSARLAPNGRLIASVPNTGDFAEWVRDQRAGRRRGWPGSWEEVGVHGINPAKIRRWCKAAGLTEIEVRPLLESARRKKWGSVLPHSAIADRFIVTARRKGARA